MKYTKKIKKIIIGTVSACVAVVATPIILTSCVNSTSTTPNNNGNGNDNNQQPNPQPGPTPPTPEKPNNPDGSEQQTPSLVRIKSQTLVKLKEDLVSLVKLNGTVLVSTANTELNKPENKNNLKKTLNLPSNINVQNVHTTANSISILMSDKYYLDSSDNYENLTFEVKQNQIIITSPKALFKTSNNFLPQATAQSLYDLINSKVKLNRTVRLSEAETLLADRSLLVEIQKVLKLQVNDVSSLVVDDLNQITINLVHNIYDDSENTINSVLIRSIGNKITLSNSSGLFLEDLLSFNEPRAKSLYDAINKIVAINNTVRYTDAKTKLSLQSSFDAVKQSLGIKTNVNDIIINDLKTITITLSSTVFSNITISYNRVEFKVVNNTIVLTTDTNFFKKDLLNFDNTIASNLYNKINSIVNLNNTVRLKDAKNKLENKNNYEIIKQSLGCVENVIGLNIINLKTIKITLDNDAFNNKTLTVPNQNITYSVENRIITITSTNDLFLEDYLNFDGDLPINIYNKLNEILMISKQSLRFSDAVKKVKYTSTVDAINQILNTRNGRVTSIDITITSITINLSARCFNDNRVDYANAYIQNMNNKILIQFDPLSAANQTGFFLPDLAEFNTITASNLYNKINSIVRLNKTVRISIAKSQLEQPANNDLIKQALNIKANVSNLKIVDNNTITFNLSELTYKNVNTIDNNINYSVSDTTITMTNNSGFFLDDLPVFNNDVAKNLYNTIYSITPLNNTIRLSDAKSRLENNNNAFNLIKTNLKLKTNVTKIEVVNNFKIRITFSGETFVPNTIKYNQTEMIVSKTTVEINGSSDFYLVNLSVFNDATASSLYNALNSIVKLNHTVRFTTAKNKLVEPVHREEIRKAINSISAIARIEVNDLKIIKVIFASEAFNNTTITVSGIKYDLNNTTLTITNTKGNYFLEDLLFISSKGQALYDAINKITPLNKSIALADGIQRLQNPNNYNAIKTALGIKGDVLDLKVNNASKITIKISEVAFNNDRFDVNDSTVITVENTTITLVSRVGFYKYDGPIFTADLANLLYNKLNSYASLNNTIRLKDGVNRLKQNSVYSGVKTALNLKSNVTDITINDVNKITVSLSADEYPTTTVNANNTNFEVIDNTIVLTKTAGFFLYDYAIFDNQKAGLLYNALNAKANLNRQTRISDAKKLLETQDAVNGVNSSLNPHYSANNVLVKDRNTITVTFDIANYLDTTINYANTTMTVKNNVITITGTNSEIFLPDMPSFTQQDANNIYDRLNNFLHMKDQSIRVTQAKQIATQQNVKDSVNQLLNPLLGTVNNIELAMDSIRITLTDRCFWDGEFEYNNAIIKNENNVITLTYKQTTSGQYGFFLADIPDFSLDTAQAIYNKLNDFLHIQDQTVRITQAKQIASQQNIKDSLNQTMNPLLGHVNSIDLTLDMITINLSDRVFNDGTYKYNNGIIENINNTITIRFDKQNSDKYGFFLLDIPTFNMSTLSGIYDKLNQSLHMQDQSMRIAQAKQIASQPSTKDSIDKFIDPRLGCVTDINLELNRITITFSGRIFTDGNDWHANAHVIYRDNQIIYEFNTSTPNKTGFFLEDLPDFTQNIAERVYDKLNEMLRINTQILLLSEANNIVNQSSTLDQINAIVSNKFGRVNSISLTKTSITLNLSAELYNNANFNYLNSNINNTNNKITINYTSGANTSGFFLDSLPPIDQNRFGNNIYDVLNNIMKLDTQSLTVAEGIALSLQQSTKDAVNAYLGVRATVNNINVEYDRIELELSAQAFIENSFVWHNNGKITSVGNKIIIEFNKNIPNKTGFFRFASTNQNWASNLFNLIFRTDPSHFELNGMSENQYDKIPKLLNSIAKFFGIQSNIIESFRINTLNSITINAKVKLFDNGTFSNIGEGNSELIVSNNNSITINMKDRNMFNGRDPRGMTTLLKDAIFGQGGIPLGRYTAIMANKKFKELGMRQRVADYLHIPVDWIVNIQALNKWNLTVEINRIVFVNSGWTSEVIQNTVYKSETNNYSINLQSGGMGMFFG